MKRINKQNVFIFASILFLGFLFLNYSGRFIYYKFVYKKKVEAITNLSERIISQNRLYSIDNEKYFKGKTNGNYVIYSSQLWQVIKLNDEDLTLVSTKPITNLYFDEDYEESIINEYLNDDFYNVLDKSLIIDTKTCINDLDNGTDKCNDTYSNKITLLSLNLYDKVGGKDSYINNGYYNYLSNGSDTHYYIDEEGNIGSTKNKELYGIKAVITIKNTEIISGSGLKNDPYVLDKEVNILSKANVGSYINFSNMLWRVIKNEDNVKLIANETIDEFNYENTTFDEDNSLYKYLNEEFILKLDKEYMVLTKFYKGPFGSSTNTLFSKINCYVGIPYLLDLYLNDMNDYLLMTKSSNSNLYYKVSNGYTSSVEEEKYGIRPIISIKNDLKIKGKGTINNPYVIEGEQDEA